MCGLDISSDTVNLT